MAEALAPLMGEHGSLVGMDFDASVAWPVYDWMGVSKAALEAVCRYLARDLGPSGVRVNLVSAGPLETPAAAASPASDRLSAGWRAQAPLGWNPADPAPVADAVCFLLSDWSRGISGEIVHVDGGFHAMGAPPGPARPGRAGRPAQARAIIAACCSRSTSATLQTHIGVFSGDTLQEHWRLATDRQATADALATTLANLLGLRDLSLRDVDSAITSSVVPVLGHEYEQLSERYLDGGLLMVGP